MVVVVVVVLVRGGKLSSMTSNHRKLGCDTSTQSHNHTHTTTITNIIKILKQFNLKGECQTGPQQPRLVNIGTSTKLTNTQPGIKLSSEQYIYSCT